jgi:signal transduction histidine kinase
VSSWAYFESRHALVDNESMHRLIAQTISILVMTLLVSHIVYAGEDCISHRAVFEDKSAQMNFEQAKFQNYSPMGTMLAKGYSDSRFWIKVHFDPRKCQDDTINKNLKGGLILRIQPPFLDDVELFDPADKSNNPRLTGDRRPWFEDEYKSLNLNFVVASGEARDIWLSLKTTSTTLFRVQALNFNDAAAADKLQELGFGIYIGLLALIFIGAFLTWWATRDWITGIFAVNQLSSFVHSVVIMGYYRAFISSYLSPNVLDVSSSVIILTFAFITTVFQYSLYRLFGSKIWAILSFYAIMFLYPLNLLLLTAGQIRLALNMNLIGLWALSLLIILIPFFGVDWKLLPKPMLSKKSLFAIYAISNLIAWINILPALGLFAANPFAPYFGLLYGIVTGFIFLAFLLFRYQQTQEERLVEVSQAMAIADFEKNKRQEQSQFLQMLTHELKTSLSVIKMAFATEGSYKKFKNYIDSAVSDINEVIDRTLLADKFDSSNIEVKKIDFDLNALLDELKILGNVEVIHSERFIINSDLNLLRRILNNLVDNGLKYGDPSKPVKVVAEVYMLGATKLVGITVRNTIGNIGAPDMERVFKKYYRSPKAHERTGSGLGLYLVRNLLALLDGSIVCKVEDNSVIFELQIQIK